MRTGELIGLERAYWSRRFENDADLHRPPGVEAFGPGALVAAVVGQVIVIQVRIRVGGDLGDGLVLVVARLGERVVPDFVAVFDVDRQAGRERVLQQRGQLLDVVVRGHGRDVDPDAFLQRVGQGDDVLPAYAVGGSAGSVGQRAVGPVHVLVAVGLGEVHEPQYIGVQVLQQVQVGSGVDRVVVGIVAGLDQVDIAHRSRGVREIKGDRVDVAGDDDVIGVQAGCGIEAGGDEGDLALVADDGRPGTRPGSVAAHRDDHAGRAGKG